jgi:hypothetical protein
MSRFTEYTPSYRANLQKLKKERAEKHVPVVYTYETNLFSNYLYNISDVNLDTIESIYYFKKSHAAKHKYNLPTPDKPSSVRLDNSFKELEIFLPRLIDELKIPVINDDFLTGYYLAKAFILKNIIPTKSIHESLVRTIKSFHVGLSSDGIVRGIWYGLINNDKIKWEFNGCDKVHKKEYTKLYKNGITKHCNAFDLNTIRSIGIQLEESLGKKIDFFISDVRPADIYDVLTQLLLCYDNVSDDGFKFIRLPLDWLSNYTAMLNIIIYAVSTYNVVSIFKTPWCKVPKLYLLVAKPKHKALTAVRYTSLTKFIELGRLSGESLNLFNKYIYDSDTDEPSYISNLADKITNTYNLLITDNNLLTCEEANTLWVDSMMS